MLAFYIVDKLRYRWTDRSSVELNIENARFTVGCSHCHRNLKFGNFTLSLGKLCQIIVLKCVPHMQHNYFSSFNQSNHCFLASLLLLLLSLLKLFNDKVITPFVVHSCKATRRGKYVFLTNIETQSVWSGILDSTAWLPSLYQVHVGLNVCKIEESNKL